MAGRSLTRCCAAALALCGAANASIACDPTLTSVGAWQQVVEEPRAGSGQGGASESAGASGAGAEGGQVEPAPQGQYLEAESGELSGGFTIGADAAASNGQYIEGPAKVLSDDVPGSARARYTFDVPLDGDYVIWGRIYAPGVSSNRFWFQLDGGSWYKWRIAVGTIWYWNYFHSDTAYNDVLRFPLAAGSHQLLIANEVPDARLDRLYVTPGTDEPPGNDTKCHPPHSIDVGGACQPSCGAQAPQGMRTSCTSATCSGKPLLVAYDCATCCVVP